ncbi:AAA family ATPase [bacterium]|nr:AAA family ATPase [candidate division CSSED10-310 bacterium]
MYADVQQLNERVRQAGAFVDTLKKELEKVIVGQTYLLERLLVGLLADGHILIEGVPGLAKTLAVKTLSDAVQVDFKRIQFTPDLLPADLTGTMVFNPRSNDFEPKQGPLFANLVLADEINRAPAKVQSALLEAMQERQVTIGDRTYPLPKPYLVLATQNPIEQEGTYPLPEAQIDRFMLKLRIGYPSRAEERLILDRMSAQEPIVIQQVIQPQDILAARKIVNEIHVDERARNYVVNLVFASRYPEESGLSEMKGLIQYGASPRATIAFIAAARAYAFQYGRGFVTPDDIKAIGPDVMRHRIILSYEAEAEELSSDDLIRMIFDRIEVP